MSEEIFGFSLSEICGRIHEIRCDDRISPFRPNETTSNEWVVTSLRGKIFNSAVYCHAIEYVNIVHNKLPSFFELVLPYILSIQKPTSLMLSLTGPYLCSGLVNVRVANHTTLKANRVQGFREVEVAVKALTLHLASCLRPLPATRLTCSLQG